MMLRPEQSEQSVQLAHRVFAPWVMSNTYDFDVRRVMHAGKEMCGVFAKRDIDEEECPVFLGVYDGYLKTPEEIEQKITNYMSRYKVSKHVAILRAISYNLTVHYAPDHDLDPSDEEGRLLPEFVSYMAFYINEPPPGELAKAIFVFNEARERHEVWLVRSVQQNEEVFLCYGEEYERDYPVNEAACETLQVAFISKASRLVLDPRGSPEPLHSPLLRSIVQDI